MCEGRGIILEQVIELCVLHEVCSSVFLAGEHHFNRHSVTFQIARIR